MGRCRFCREEAGWFRREHRACREAHDRALAALHEETRNTLTGGSPAALPDRVAALRREGRLKPEEVRSTLLKAWSAAVEAALEDHVLTEEEEHRLKEGAERLGLKQEELQGEEAFRRLVKAAVLREVLAGEVPRRVRVDGPLPFNLQKSENLVWAEPGMRLYEERRRRRYVGGYQGVSVRIMRGVYYRVGGFRGRPVETTELTYVDTGLLGLTTKHLYFAGAQRRFRLRYDRIVSFEPFSDGLGVYPEAASRRPMILRGGDGWFLYNLAVNLGRTA